MRLAEAAVFVRQSARLLVCMPSCRSEAMRYSGMLVKMRWPKGLFSPARFPGLGLEKESSEKTGILLVNYSDL